MRNFRPIGKLRDYFSVILLLTFLFNSFGITFVYQRMQSSARETMKQHLRGMDYASTIITQLFFKKGEAPPDIEEDEILYNDTKYDIIAVKYTPHYIIYSCIEDKLETALLSAFVKGLMDEIRRGVKHQPVKNILDSEITSGLPPADNGFCPVLEYQFLTLQFQIHGDNIILSIPKPPPRTTC